MPSTSPPTSSIHCGKEDGRGELRSPDQSVPTTPSQVLDTPFQEHLSSSAAPQLTGSSGTLPQHFPGDSNTQRTNSSKWTTTRTSNRGVSGGASTSSGQGTPVSQSPAGNQLASHLRSSPNPQQHSPNTLHPLSSASPQLNRGARSSSGGASSHHHPPTSTGSTTPGTSTPTTSSSNYQPLIHAGGRLSSNTLGPASSGSLYHHLSASTGGVGMRASASQVSLGGMSYSSLDGCPSHNAPLTSLSSIGALQGSSGLRSPPGPRAHHHTAVPEFGLGGGVAGAGSGSPLGSVYSLRINHPDPACIHSNTSGSAVGTPATLPSMQVVSSPIGGLSGGSGASGYCPSPYLPSEVLALNGGVGGGGNSVNLEACVKTTSSAMAEIASRLMDLVESTQPEKETHKASLAKELLAQAAPVKRLTKTFSGRNNSGGGNASGQTRIFTENGANNNASSTFSASSFPNPAASMSTSNPSGGGGSLSQYPPGVDPSTKMRVLGQTYSRFGVVPVSLTIITAFIYTVAPLEPLGDSPLASRIFALSLLFFLLGYCGIYALHHYCVVVELHRRCRNTINVFVQRTVADIGLFPTVWNSDGGGLADPGKEGGPTNATSGVHCLPKSFLTIRAMKAMNVVRDGALRIIPKALLINGDIRLDAPSMDYFVYRDATKCCKLFDAAKAMLLHFPIRLRQEVFPPPKRHPNMCLSEGIEEVEDTSDDDDGESEPRSTTVGNSIPSVPAQMEYYVHRLMVLMWFASASVCFLIGLLRYFVASSFYGSNYGTYVPAKFICPTNSSTTLDGNTNFKESFIDFPQSLAIFVHEALLLPTVATLGFIPLAIAGMSRVMTLVCNAILHIFFLQLQRFGPPLSPEKAVLNAPSWTEIKLVTRRILAHVFTGYDVGKPIAFSRNLLETLGTTTVVGALDATGVLTDMIPVPQKVLFINENPYGDGVHGSDSDGDDDSDDSSSSTSFTDSSSCDDTFSSSSSTTSKTASIASTVSVHDGDSDTSSQKARRRRRAKRQKCRERRRRIEEKERRRREKLGNFMTPQARKAAKAKERALKVQVKRKKFQEQRFTTLSTYLSGKDDLVVAFEDKEVEQHKTSVNALGLCCLIHALHTNVRDSQTYTASLRHVDRTNFWAKCLHWLPRALNFKDSDAAHYQVVRRVHMIESSKKGSGAYPSQLTGLLAIDCHVPDAPLHLFVLGFTQMVVHACDTYWTGTRIEEFDDYEKEEVVYVASKQFQELQGMEAVSCAHRILPVRYKKHLLSGVTVTPSLYGTGSTVAPVEHFFIDGKEISESSAEEIRAGRNQGQGRQRRSHSVPIPPSINRAFPTKRIVRSLSCGESPRNTEGQYQKDESVNVRNMIGLMMSTGHSFLGLVGLQDNVRPHVESAVNILNDAGIRFMYFGAGSENATKAHGKRFGLETGWNSCISLKAESVALDPQSIRAQLPFGVQLIRQHIVHVDPIPLQVSLFSHCRGHSTRSMVSVLQDNHEVCTILGCSLSHCNALSFVQTDVAVSATATPLGSPALAKARHLLPQHLTHTAVTSTNVDDTIVSAPLNVGSAIYESRESWYLNTFARVWGGEARPAAGGQFGQQQHSATSSGGSSVAQQPASPDVPSSPLRFPRSPTTDPADRSWVHTGNLANAAPSTTRSLRNVSDVLSAMCSLKLNDSINSLPIITVLIRESRNMLRSLSSILDFIAGASVAVALLQVFTIVSGLPLLLTEGTTSFFLFVLIPIHALSTTFDTGSWDCMTAVIAKHSFRTRSAIIRHKALIFSLRYPITILFILLSGAISVSSVMSEGAKRSDPTDAYIHITKNTLVRDPILSTTDENYDTDAINPSGSCVVVDDYSGYGSVGGGTTSTPVFTSNGTTSTAMTDTDERYVSPYVASASHTSSNPFWSPRVLLLPQVDLVPVRVFTAILLNVMLSIHALTYVTRHRYLTLRWRFRNAAERKQSVTIAKCKRWFTITVFANVIGFVFQQCSLWTASWDETELRSLLVSGTYRKLTPHQQEVYGNVFMCIPAGVPVWCIVVGFLVLPVVMLLLDYPLKRWRHRRYIEVQKYRRLAFGTRLGMHSPQGDYEPDNNANAAATTEQALMDELSAEAAAEEEAAAIGAACAGNGLDKVPLRGIDNADPHFSDTTNVNVYDSHSMEDEEMQGGSESQSGGWSDSPSGSAVAGGSHSRRHHHHHHHHHHRIVSSDGANNANSDDAAAASSFTTAPSSPTSPMPPATTEMSHGDGSEELWAHESGLLPRRVLRFLYRFLSVEEGRMESSCVCCDHPDGGGARAKYQLMNLQ